MKQITDKQIEDLINIKLNPMFDKFKSKADAISKNIDNEKNYQLIKNAISDKITYKENTFFNYTKLCNILYKIIFEKNIDISYIVSTSDMTDIILNESLIEGKTFTHENRKELTEWLHYTLIPEIVKQIALAEKDKYMNDDEQPNTETNKDNLLELIDKAISFKIDAEKEIKFLDTAELGNILYSFIFEQNSSLKEMTRPEIITGIINECLIVDHENLMSDEIFISSITRWLKYHVIPYIYEHKEEYEAEDKEVISTGFSGLPEKDEMVSKSQITACIFPLNLNYISKEKFDQLPKDIINIIHDYINNYGYDIEYYTLINAKNVYYEIISKNEISEQLKSTLLKWLDKAVIPCIISTTEKKEYISDFKQIEFEINKASLLYKRMDKIVRDFYDSFYLTQKQLCLYYTYYILRLKENHDFDFEFRESENKLYKDFYNYGIFACIGELRHFLETFHFTYYTGEIKRTEEISKYIKNLYTTTEQTIFKPGFKKLTSDISECVGIDVEDIYKIINIDKMHTYTQNLYSRRYNLDEKENKIIKDIEFLYLIEKYFGYFTRPDNILKVSLKSFNISKDNKIKCRWSESYGGEAWGSIAKTMLHRSNLVSKTIFVDTCWSLQHNTNLFLDKVCCYDCKGNNFSLIKNYLTEIKDGLFKNVYECALKHNKKLDRFIYKNLILENDKSVPEAKYTEKYNYTEREPRQRREPDYERSDYEQKRRRLPEKEDINIVQFDDEQKYKVYKEIDENYGLKNAEIYKLEYGWKDNPDVEIIIDSAPFKWITDLNSIMKYMNEHYPLSAYQKTEPIKSEEIQPSGLSALFG